MDFSYNAHLLLKERIEDVQKDIIKKYPFINCKQATKIAKLEGAISEKANFDIIFTRYYNILIILKDNKNLYNIVLKDFINICKNNYIDEEKYTLLESAII